MLRYISGTGAEGMKVSPEEQTGRQLYSDIQRTRKVVPRLPSIAAWGHSHSPNNPAYMKENILRGNTHLFIMAACLIHLHLIGHFPKIKENVGS